MYCGDGVSDISAARETDLLFAKKGKDLVKHCLIQNVPFYPFDVPSLILLWLLIQTFAEINAVVADLESGKRTVAQVVEQGRILAQSVSGDHESMK